MAVAGAILHDIGKLRELEQQPNGTVYTASGGLIGHLLQGRNIVREAAAACPLPADAAAAGAPDHRASAAARMGLAQAADDARGAVVHYADDIDAKFHMMAEILRNDTGDGRHVEEERAHAAGV